MPFLEDDQRVELSDESLAGKTARITRADSVRCYVFSKQLKPRKPGMKSVVWLSKDDLGDDVVLKIVSSDEYSGASILDEMTHARKLEYELFASIEWFGDLAIDEKSLRHSYKAIAIEYVPGKQLDDFVEQNPLSVEQFISISKELFTALAILGSHGLCHDDLHPGNVLITRIKSPINDEYRVALRIIDTGTVKRTSTRDNLLELLKSQITTLKSVSPAPPELLVLEQRLNWKTPTDHFRAVECLLHAANSLAINYHRFNHWEQRFIDGLDKFFLKLTDADPQGRLESPQKVLEEIDALLQTCRVQDTDSKFVLTTPFDYISAEMIRSDREFSELFSKECPWLSDCQTLEPIYLYGPRGSGKSSVLRWLAFKTLASDSSRAHFAALREIGVYMSCSVELRSRFWLLEPAVLDKLQPLTIKFFNLLLLEELFDTLSYMRQLEESGTYQFGLGEKAALFSQWVVRRLSGEASLSRCEGQGYFHFLRTFVRSLRWDTWADIQNMRTANSIVDPSLSADICRELQEYFPYFKSRHITYLVDDYSNQRIPVHLQRQLNKTVNFAKQGTPIFKVSAEYQGVDLEDIQQGREVIEINIGEKYISLQSKAGSRFLEDIINIRLGKNGYVSNIVTLLGTSPYDEESMAKAIAESRQGKQSKQEKGKRLPFYYYGLDCVHWLCSGDVALALDLVRRIFQSGSTSKETTTQVAPKIQDSAIQQYSHDEVWKIRYVVPDGTKLFDIVRYLGAIANAFVMGKKSSRKDKRGDPVCKTHIDIRLPILSELQESDPGLFERYKLLTSRAILISLLTTRSRLAGSLERLQMKRIYFPSFKAPVARDVPVKLDDLEDIKSLLSDPHTFAERELKKSSIPLSELQMALDLSKLTPVE